MGRATGEELSGSFAVFAALRDLIGMSSGRKGSRKAQRPLKKTWRYALWKVATKLGSELRRIISACHSKRVVLTVTPPDKAVAPVRPITPQVFFSGRRGWRR